MTIKNFSNTTIFHWARQLIGSSSSFVFNLSTVSLVGIIYSFKITASPVILGVFGLLNPTFLTIFVYQFIKELPKDFMLGGVSMGAFFGRRRVWMLTTDVSIIVALSLLIYFGPLNMFLFRFLLLFILPLMLLVGLRFLYIIYMLEQHHSASNKETNVQE